MNELVHDFFMYYLYSIAMGDPLITDDPTSPTPTMGTAARILAIFLLFFVTAQIGLSLNSVESYISLIWAPSGIALAAFILYSNRVWPSVFAAAFLVSMLRGCPFLIAAAMATGTTIAPAIGAQYIRKYAVYQAEHPEAPQLRDTFSIMFAAVLLPFISATIGALSLLLGGEIGANGFGVIWRTWWIGDMLGMMLFTPFILKWFNTPFIERTRAQFAELTLVLFAVGVTSYAVFWLQSDFVYYLFIPLIWAALRTGQRGATLSIVLAAVIAIGGTVTGHGPFVHEGLIHLQIFLAVMAGVILIFASTAEERRRAAQTLEKHSEELEQALTAIRSEDQAKKDFIAILAHELRNPLATILSSIELIQMQGVAEVTTPELLTTINERSRSMVRLLDDLLDISRISEKKLRLHISPVPVGAFFDKLGRIVFPLMKRYGHVFAMTHADDALFLLADSDRLKQIMLNLLANAARYTKTKGTIQVDAKRDGQFYAIHIRDKGVGIPRGMLRRIFEPFFQVNRDTVSYEGIGVGLTLTRELIELHGGTIEATSGSAGKGSEFIVRIPLAETPVQAEMIPQPSPIQRAALPYLDAGAQLKRVFRILVVDDNQAASDALSQLLDLREHTTEVAATGAEAIQKAIDFEPEVIFLDIGLPDMTGYDVVRALRVQKKPYFVVALTGYGQQDDRERAKAAGIDEHLTKPAGFKEIQAVLRKVPHSLRAVA